jgi:excisionase family DNA binding protein
VPRCNCCAVEEVAAVSGGELLRVREVAALLGVTRRVCYNLVSRGVLPGVVRSGRALFIRKRALERWLQGHVEATGSCEGDGPAAQVGAGLSGGAP